MLRRKEKSIGEDAAWRTLSAAHAVHLASTSADGQPVLRALNAVVFDGAVYVHGSPKGKKNGCIGRPAVVTAHEVYADIPSYFMHPERACPATTLYSSAMVHGLLEEVSDVEEKAQMLRRLMERYQPEGGYVAIDIDNPLYAKAVRGLRVLKVRAERIVGKEEVYAQKPHDVRRSVAEQLWVRGRGRDVETAQRVLDVAPLDRWPERFSGPDGARFLLWPGPSYAEEAALLVHGAYWNAGVSVACLTQAHAGSSAWVVAVDAAGTLIATARANSDGHKSAYVLDVMVRRGFRGRGLGDATMRVLLDHPAVRDCVSVVLTTKDAEAFYSRTGFEVLARRTAMVRCASLASG